MIIIIYVKNNSFEIVFCSFNCLFWIKELCFFQVYIRNSTSASKTEMKTPGIVYHAKQIIHKYVKQNLKS